METKRPRSQNWDINERVSLITTLREIGRFKMNQKSVYYKYMAMINSFHKNSTLQIRLVTLLC